MVRSFVIFIVNFLFYLEFRRLLRGFRFTTRAELDAVGLIARETPTPRLIRAPLPPTALA